MEIDIEFIWKLNDMHQSSGLTKFNKNVTPSLNQPHIWRSKLDAFTIISASQNTFSVRRAYERS